MKKSILAIAIVIGMVLMAGAARADVVFTLDALVLAGTPAPVGPAPYGTVTLANNGANIDVTILLNAGNGNPFVLSLNYLVNPGSGWSASGGTVATGVNISGFNGWFDIRVADTAPNPNPLVFTLSKTATDLDVATFVTKDVTGTYYAIVRTTGGDSVSNFYGATTVPEPSTLLLLGSGLLGLVVYGRRRMKK